MGMEAHHVSALAFGFALGLPGCRYSCCAGNDRCGLFFHRVLLASVRIVNDIAGYGPVYPLAAYGTLDIPDRSHGMLFALFPQALVCGASDRADHGEVTVGTGNDGAGPV
jgi:hypothetical protein